MTYLAMTLPLPMPDIAAESPCSMCRKFSGVTSFKRSIWHSETREAVNRLSTLLCRSTPTHFFCVVMGNSRVDVRSTFLQGEIDVKWRHHQKIYV